MMEDYYTVLNISRNASIDEIRKSYKELALKYHPDKCKDVNSEHFKRVNEAYQILNDPDKKILYDLSLEQQQSNSGSNELIQKLMSNLFKFLADFKKSKEKSEVINRRSSTILKLQIPVTLEELYHGNPKKIKLKVKNNNVQEHVTLFVSLVNFQRRPPQVFKNMGDSLNESVTRQDIEITFEIQQHDLFKVDDICGSYDVLCFEQPLSLYEFYYGIDRNMSHFDGEDIYIKGFFKSLSKLILCIKNRGLLYLDDESNEIRRGDFVIYFKLTLPTLLDEEKHVFKSLAEDYFK